MNVTALMAIPGAGKSTFVAEALSINPAVVVCPDEIRLQLTGDMTSQDRNGEVFEIARALADATLAQGKDVIWDATNVTARARADILKTARAHEASTTLVVLDVPLALAKQRNQSRERVVPEHVLDRMFGQFHDALSEIGHEAWDCIEFERIG